MGYMLHLPTDVSIELHKYSHELSGRLVAEPTTAVRTIANVIVMMTSEKMPARASFLCHFICTPQSIVIGIDITVDIHISKHLIAARSTYSKSP